MDLDRWNLHHPHHHHQQQHHHHHIELSGLIYVQLYHEITVADVVDEVSAVPINTILITIIILTTTIILITIIVVIDQPFSKDWSWC